MCDFTAKHTTLHDRVVIVKSHIDACKFHLGLPLVNVVVIVRRARYGAVDGYVQIWTAKIYFEYFSERSGQAGVS